jgi:hypothetical protein
MPGSTTSSWFRSFLAVMFYPAFLSAASLPVLHVLGMRNAVVFGLEALAWLMFGRLIVFGVFGYAIAKVTSAHVSRVVLSALVDGIAVYAAYRLDVRCVWGALTAIVFAEVFLWWPEGGAA